jgi:hypothetical protein
MNNISDKEDKDQILFTGKIVPRIQLCVWNQALIRPMKFSEENESPTENSQARPFY